MASVRSDEESFEALFTAEYARVAGIANRVLADPDEAEDIWLVCEETKAIIQIPVGTVLLFPSALVTHYNVRTTSEPL